MAGDAVPQVYLDAPANQPSGAQFAPRTLVGFDRVTLGVGESRSVTLHVASRAFQYWSVTGNAWKTPAGSRNLHVGFSSRDLATQVSVE